MSVETSTELRQFVAELDRLLADARAAFASASESSLLESARIEFIGARQGRLKAVQKQLAAIPVSDKPAAGQRLNQVKQEIEAAFENAQVALSGAKKERVRDILFDVSLPGTPVRTGRLHPITRTIDELKDIMGRLGFTAADGPEVEDRWHNFDALNIPEDHPARDPLDNFYLAVAGAVSDAGESLLRSQTSTVQIRVMENRKPPLRIISLGRVYRPDTADATHYPMFHQMEGLLVDHKVTLADLKTVLRLFATSYLGESVPVRIRPSFFPFTEPSVEADYFWNGRWVEFGGAGLVDPNVLAAVGYDPETTSGFAFGLGVERLCMIRHKISDLRALFTNDVRFLRQFPPG